MKHFSSLLFWTGLILFEFSFFLFFLVYYPVLREEASYFLWSRGASSSVALGSSNNKKNAIIPNDENFGIVIPKINANSKVVKNVNPFNSSEYQVALTKGVAHAKGSAYPGQFGNVFLFSHSSVNFYEASKYNSVFYLLSKLNKGDDIYIFYNKTKLKYKIVGKKTVSPNDVSYLAANNSKKHTLTLMTCWPPGTTLNRLIIVAEISE